MSTITGSKKNMLYQAVRNKWKNNKWADSKQNETAHNFLLAGGELGGYTQYLDFTQLWVYLLPYTTAFSMNKSGKKAFLYGYPPLLNLLKNKKMSGKAGLIFESAL